MYILGLNFTTHDASAALIKDGEVLFAAEEERYSRKKHTKAFPENAIYHCLEYAKITKDDIDKIAVFISPKQCKNIIIYNLISDFPKTLLYIPYAIKWIKLRKKISFEIEGVFGPKIKRNIEFVNHHIAHAGSSFFCSGLSDSLILTVDGRGEYETIGVYDGKGNKIKKLKSIKYPHSIGYFYSMITKYLGFIPQYDEYKVMGLASYGHLDNLNLKVKDMYYSKNNLFKLNLSYFDHHYKYGNDRKLYSDKFIKEFGGEKNKDNLTQENADLALTVQESISEIVLNILRFYKCKFHYKNLCFAGGVALNCSLNAKISEANIFENIFIQPAANDAGTSIGAALITYYKYFPNNEKQKLTNVYLGNNDDNIHIDTLKNKYNLLEFSKYDNFYEIVAEYLHQGKVIGWFQGRMEFGPRALGNRSILANPQIAEMKEIINSKIKFREQFRPFAPVVLSQYAPEYFYINENAYNLYPYMLCTVKAKENINKIIPAVVHVDNTSRIQIVNQENNLKLYLLLQEFKKLTGVPVLLNTSFNVKGEPIVSTAEDAINSYLNSELDYLIINDIIICRKSQ